MINNIMKSLFLVRSEFSVRLKEICASFAIFNEFGNA